jgi:hypothetical protein
MENEMTQAMTVDAFTTSGMTLVVKAVPCIYDLLVASSFPMKGTCYD